MIVVFVPVTVAKTDVSTTLGDFPRILEDDAVPMSFLPPRHGENGDQEERLCSSASHHWERLTFSCVEDPKISKGYPTPKFY